MTKTSIRGAYETMLDARLLETSSPSLRQTCDRLHHGFPTREISPKRNLMFLRWTQTKDWNGGFFRRYVMYLCYKYCVLQNKLQGRDVNEASWAWGQGWGRGQKEWGRGRGPKNFSRPRPDTLENNSVCMSMKTKTLFNFLSPKS